MMQALNGKSFADRLNRLLARGNLSIADLQAQGYAYIRP